MSFTSRSLLPLLTCSSLVGCSLPRVAEPTALEFKELALNSPLAQKIEAPTWNEVGERDLSALRFMNSELKEEILPTVFILADGRVSFQVPVSSYQALQCSDQKRSFKSDGDLSTQAEQLISFLTPDDPMISELANLICRDMKTPEESAQALLDFVRAEISYDQVEADSDKNYFRFPLETLMERRGDCEDLSILYISLCKSVGIDAVFLRSIGHVSVLVQGAHSGLGVEVETESDLFYIAEATFPAGVSIGAGFEELRGVIFHPERGYLKPTHTDTAMDSKESKD